MILTSTTKAVLSSFSLVLMAGASHAATYLVDFGAANATTTTDALNRSWNNVTPNTQPTAAGLLALADTTGALSGPALAITSANTGRFADSNGNGDNPAKGDAAARNYPTTSTQDSLYGYATAAGATFTAPTGAVTLTLSGLTAGQRYDFFGFAARNSNDNRSEILSFQGAGSAVNVVYDPGMNTTGSVFASGDVLASSTGGITLTLSPNTTNASANQFFYLACWSSPRLSPSPPASACSA